MAQTDIKPYYTVTLSAEEFRVVCLSLAGKVKEQRDIDYALELNLHLLQNRKKLVENYLSMCGKSLQQAEALVK